MSNEFKNLSNNIKNYIKLMRRLCYVELVALIFEILPMINMQVYFRNDSNLTETQKFPPPVIPNELPTFFPFFFTLGIFFLHLIIIL